MGQIPGSEAERNTLTAMMYAMVAKVVKPALSSLKKVTPWISSGLRLISIPRAHGLEENRYSHGPCLIAETASRNATW